MRQIAALLLAAVALASCGREEAGANYTHEVTDSSGVRIVEYGEQALANSGIELTELLRIGAAEGAPELLFSNLVGGLILRDGSLVLADRGSAQIRRFDRDGTFLGSHGRAGEGPGEYSHLIGLARCRSAGFTALDIGWRMSHYDEEGRFQETEQVRLEGLSSPYHLACHPSGRMAAIDWGDIGARNIGFYTSMARLRILDTKGNEVADLGARIGSERLGSPGGSGPHPIGRSTRFGFSGSELIVADGTIFGFERWNEDGSLVEIVRIDVQPPAVDSLMEAYSTAMLADVRNEELLRQLRQELNAMELPVRATHLSALKVSDERILLREPDVAPGSRWFEFAPDGTPRGWLPLPDRAQLLDIRGDLVLVAERDELDVPLAVLYRFVPRE